MLALAAAALLVTAAPASADDDRVASYTQAITLAADGTAHVVLDLVVDFGSSPNHGPYLTLPVKQRYDDTRDRVFRVTDVEATSRTAPAPVDTEEEAGLLVVRIGEEDTTVTGEHTYRISYDVQGWVNPAGYAFPAGPLEHDELYLDAVDRAWTMPIDRASVTVTGPTGPIDVACYAGPVGSTDECDRLTPTSGGARFDQRGLQPYQPLTVALAWPAGTFDAEPLLQERWSAGRAFALTPWTGAGAVLVGLVGTGLVVGRARRRGRDQAFLGLTPGLTPAPGQTAATGPRPALPVSVQFAPPPGLRPGQLGTLVDEHADVRDVTATLVDLAVRGYLVIERTGDGAEPDWVLHRTDKPDDDLVGYEHRLLSAVFEDGGRVALSDLRTTFLATLHRVQELLYDDVTERGWFAGNPSGVRARWVGAGVGVILLGALVTTLLAIWTHAALVGLPLVAVGVLVLLVARTAPARTPTGSAVLAQTEGFRRYLATAEADQLRFEEGEDLFSRYLPFAVAFGLTDRWTRVFAELAARGAALPDPTWYVGAWGHGAFWAYAGAFGEDVARFTSVADAAISAPTPSTSGGSGFSSGGGFSGGGIGGGGGGSW